jgi:D-3-phosphoglycerate dehydrogenase
MLNRSRGELAYNLVDVAGEVGDAVLDQLRGIEGVLSVRLLAV